MVLHIYIMFMALTAMACQSKSFLLLRNLKSYICNSVAELRVIELFSTSATVWRTLIILLQKNKEIWTTKEDKV